MKPLLKITAALCICVAAGVSAGMTLSAQGAVKKTFTMTGTSFSGVFVNEKEIHVITAPSVPCCETSVCLYHAKGLDFDFTVFNGGVIKCFNTDTTPESCCAMKGKGDIRIQINTVTGKGPYTVKITTAR